MSQTGVTVLRVACVVLLAALSAKAEVTDFHVSVSLGLSASKPLGARHGLVWNPSLPGVSGLPLQADCAVSGEVGFETKHALVGVSVEHGGFVNDQPDFDLIALRGGAIFGSGSVGPYVALGGGAMMMDVWSPLDSPPARVHASGVAVLAEAGVLFLRDKPFGRIALALRFIEPLFGMQGPSGSAGQHSSDRIPLLLFTTRVSL